MSVGLRVYELLTDAGEDRVRAKVIADGFELLEERTAPLRDTATQGHLRETELRLQKEIKEAELRLQKEITEAELRLQKEIREVELRMQKEIEGVRLEIKGVELRLQKEIQSVEAQGEKNRADLVRWVVGVGMLQSTLIIGVLLKVAHLL